MPEATPTTPKNPTTSSTVQDEMSPAVPIPAGSMLRTTIRAAQVVTSTSRIVYGGVGSMGANWYDSGVTFTTGTVQ